MPPVAPRKLLAIESSCDEAAAAVVDEELRILSNVVAAQTELHRRFGGVVPEVASRAHVQLILPVIDEAQRRLCELLVASRLGLKQVPTGALEKSIRSPEQVIEGLKALAFEA